MLTAVAASAVPGDARDARTDVRRSSPRAAPDDGLAAARPRAARAGLDRSGVVRGAADGRRGRGPGPARPVAAQPRLSISGRADGADPAAGRRLQDAANCAPPWCSGCSTTFARCRASCRRATTQNAFVPGFSYQTLIKRQGPADAGRPAAHGAVPPRQPRLLQDHADQDDRRPGVHRRRRRWIDRRWRSSAGGLPTRCCRGLDPIGQILLRNSQPAAVDHRRRRGRCVRRQRDAAARADAVLAVGAEQQLRCAGRVRDPDRGRSGVAAPGGAGRR